MYIPHQDVPLVLLPEVVIPDYPRSLLGLVARRVHISDFKPPILGLSFAVAAPLMAPPTETFPASQLSSRVHLATNGKRRKGDEIKLEDCELMEMVQYSCELEGKKKDVIKCRPIVKLFRK